jgi:hypothetical protein
MSRVGVVLKPGSPGESFYTVGSAPSPHWTHRIATICGCISSEDVIRQKPCREGRLRGDICDPLAVKAEKVLARLMHIQIFTSVRYTIAAVLVVKLVNSQVQCGCNVRSSEEPRIERKIPYSWSRLC